MGAAITSSPQGQSITDSTQAQLQLSYASAADLAEQNPQYASQILAAAKQSFLDGDDWAYTAGIVAILLGAVLVFLRFPRHAEEETWLSSDQVAVNVEELNLRRGHADLLDGRHDLLLGEPLELFP